MAGTDSSRVQADTVITKVAPKVLLVRPQLAENIGMVARAMLNCGLTEMRLVTPREPHDAAKALSASAGATVVLEDAQLYDSTREAVADAHWVVATTARRREQVKPVLTPRRAAAEMRARVARGEKVVILFGQERAGLHNDDVSIADAICEVPLNPAYCSLNLAQAVLLMGYEWFQSGVDVPEQELVLNDTFPATQDEVLNLYSHMERELELCGFLRVEEKRPTMVRNIRSIFNRSQLTDQDVRTLHGILTMLTNGSVRQARKLGLDVSKLRPQPMPLYTSQPLFDSAFVDDLNMLVLADDGDKVATDDVISSDLISGILETVMGAVSEPIAERLSWILCSSPSCSPVCLALCSKGEVTERAIGGVLQTLILIARAQGLKVTENSAQTVMHHENIPAGSMCVACVSIVVPEAVKPDPALMISKGRKTAV